MKLRPLLLSLLVTTLFAQDQARIRKDLDYLAGPACEGRATGTKGQATAASYIARRMRENGLFPLRPEGLGGETLYHFPYGLERARLDLAKSGLRLGDRFLPLGTECLTFLPQGQDAEAVLIGYGLKVPEAGWDDFKDVDLKGKWAVVFQGLPAEGPFKEDPRHPAGFHHAKLKAAEAAGALGLIVVQGTRKGDADLGQGARYLKEAQARPRLMAKEGTFKPLPPFSLQILGEGRKRLADLLDPMQEALDRTGKPQPAKALGKWTYELTRQVEPVQASNLVGVVPGTDPRLKDEVILVSAHHDHLGQHEGKVFLGADDNASGTAGILEVARLLSKAKPRRTVLFLSVSGEEDGLLGSAAFIARPPLDLSRVKADINLDMIGRGKEDEIHVTPARIEGAVTTLVLEARKSAARKGLQLGAGAEAYWRRSDHYNFVRKGIPAIFFFAGMHEDYHRATDTPDKINLSKLARIVDLTADVVLTIANADEAPKPVPKDVWEAWTWSTSSTAPEPRAAGF